MKTTLATLLVCIMLAGPALALTDAQLFSGVFNFVNSTQFFRDGSTPYRFFPDGPIGGITYTPAYSGASTGNMTALWGQIWGGASHPITPPSSATPQQILADTYGYGGSYALDADNKIMRHYPVVSTLVSTYPGTTQQRSYRFLDGGNLLNLYVADPTDGFVIASLYWQRVHPLAAGAPCNLAITYQQDSTWVAGDGRHTRYVVKVTNNGATSAVSVNFDIRLNGVTLESYTQASPVAGSTTQFSAQLYGLAAGSSYNAAQFQVKGNGAFDAVIVSSVC